MLDSDKVHFELKKNIGHDVSIVIFEYKQKY